MSAQRTRPQTKEKMAKKKPIKPVTIKCSNCGLIYTKVGALAKVSFCPFKHGPDGFNPEGLKYVGCVLAVQP